MKLLHHRQNQRSRLLGYTYFIANILHNLLLLPFYVPGILMYLHEKHHIKTQDQHHSMENNYDYLNKKL
jgi:hypothetical protein